MAKIVVQTASFKKPKWPAGKLKPGQKAKLTVEAPKITASQHVDFRIRSGDDVLDVVSSAAGKAEVEWVVPNLPDTPKLKFDAVLREKPTPANGHRAVLDSVESPEAEVAGYKVEITKIDETFVPKTEKIEVTWKVTDTEAAAKKGRIEVWGERYPSNLPLYTENFTPADGDKEWKTWDGKANAGVLNGEYITPEFAPYRIRVVIGPDQACVEKPYEDGLSKATAAESAFEVRVESLWIRLQSSLTESATDEEYKFDEVLQVEPRNANGSYAAKGRLPKEGEQGRIRIPMARHNQNGDSLSQGGLAIADAYSGGSTKWTIDQGIYSRPQIPVEYEVRLRSRDDSNNTDTDKKGLWVKEGIGPLKIDIVAQDFYRPSLFEGSGNLQTYWKNAAFKVKSGTHDAPKNSGGGTPANSPMFKFWQARIEIKVDDTETINISSFDNTLTYKMGASELTVYLNRTKLESTDDDDVLSKGRKDYKEIDDHTIKLRPKFAKQKDILWIVRKDTTAGGGDVVDKWEAYPPGVNCHVHYGGVRAKKANNLFLKNYEAGTGSEPVIGKTADFPWKEADLVNLKPDPLDDAEKQERVEVMAIQKAGDTKRGLAGVLFSPSFIAGDSYELKGYIDRCPFDRNLGCVSEEKPKWEGKTGDLTVWRWIRILKSIRLHTTGTGGLASGVGSAAEPVSPPYHADGVNMSVSGINTMQESFFNEWTMKAPSSGSVHQDINLTDYITAHDNARPNSDKGKVTIGTVSKVKNYMGQYDHYRVQLPPGFPANRVNVAANKIATLAGGTPSQDAANAVDGAITTHETPVATVGDATLNSGVTALPVYSGAANAYFNWVYGQAKQNVLKVLDATSITPKTTPAKKMNVVRWPELHDQPTWNSGKNSTTGMSWEGTCIGDGQSVFKTATLSDSLFAHEMGHSTHLVHFAANNFGWKHHDLTFPNCYMSYNFPVGFIVKPPGAVGTGGTADTGWPGTVPASLPSSSSIVPSTPAGTGCIQFGPGLSPSTPCAKCALKLRGWKDDVLPCAWKHPDLF